MKNLPLKSALSSRKFFYIKLEEPLKSKQTYFLSNPFSIQPKKCGFSSETTITKLSGMKERRNLRSSKMFFSSPSDSHFFSRLTILQPHFNPPLTRYEGFFQDETYYQCQSYKINEIKKKVEYYSIHYQIT